MLQLNYLITEEEFLAYYYYMCWQRPERRAFRFGFSFVAMVVSVFGIGGLLYAFDGKLTTVSALLSLSSGMMLGLLSFFGMRSAFNNKARKMLERSGRGTILSPVELTIDTTGIFGKKETAEVKYLWTAFKGKALYNNCYYLYINYEQAFVIPFRAFQDIEKDKFESLLSQHLPLEGFQAK